MPFWSMVTPGAEAAVIAAGVLAFGRWSRGHPRSTVGSILWLAGVAAAILAGLDLWNWLPGWGHPYVSAPICAPAPCTVWVGGHPLPHPNPVPLFFSVLFQQFMRGAAPGGGVSFNYFLRMGVQMPQIYLTAVIAGAFWAVYLLGAGQYRRLRWTLPRAVVVAVAATLLRVVWQAARHHHAGVMIEYLGWSQIGVLLLAVPSLVIKSMSLAASDSRGR